jgi:hypothetical protein
MSIGIGFILGLMAWLFASNQKYSYRITLIIMILLGNFMIILPWEAWMYHRTAKIIPLSACGTNALRDGLTSAVKSKGYRHGITVPPDVRALQEDLSKQYEKMSNYGGVASVLTEKLQSQPKTVFKLFLIKAGPS